MPRDAGGLLRGRAPAGRARRFPRAGSTCQAWQVRRLHCTVECLRSIPGSSSWPQLSVHDGPGRQESLLETWGCRHLKARAARCPWFLTSAWPDPGSWGHFKTADGAPSVPLSPSCLSSPLILYSFSLSFLSLSLAFKKNSLKKIMFKVIWLSNLVESSGSIHHQVWTAHTHTHTSTQYKIPHMITQCSVEFRAPCKGQSCTAACSSWWWGVFYLPFQIHVSLSGWRVQYCKYCSNFPMGYFHITYVILFSRSVRTTCGAHLIGFPFNYVKGTIKTWTDTCFYLQYYS